MTIYEYGTEQEKKVLFIATAALEPYWAFQKQAEALGESYHVYAVAADGHDGKPGDFVSVEKTVADMTAELKRRGVAALYAAYGLSMGGAIIVRFLATGSIPTKKAIIDGGILPYTYPKWICRLIHAKDYLAMRTLTKSRWLLELAAPPEKYTAEGNDPKEEYDALKQYERNGVQIVKDGEVVANENGITNEQMVTVQDAIANLDNSAKIQFLDNEEMRSLVQAFGGEAASGITQSASAEREEEQKYRQTVREINNDTTLSPELKQKRLEAAKRTRQNAKSEASKIADTALTNKKGIGAKLETDGNGTVKVGKGSGKVTYDFSTKDNPGHQSVDSMTATEQSVLRIAKIVAASRSDVNVKVEAEFVGEHVNENGYYDRSTNTIHINMSGDNSVLWTLSHELTHHLANTDTEAYAALRAAIETALKDSKLTTTELEERGFEYDIDRVDPYIAREGNLWDALVAFEREEHGYGKNAEEEVVARCCESFLGFNQFVKEFAHKQYKSAKAINKFIAQMNIDMQRVSEEALQSAEQRNIWNDESPENQILRQLTEIDRIANLWRIAVNAEAKKRQVTDESVNTNTRVHMSFMDGVTLNGNVDRILNMNNDEAMRMKEEGLFVQVMDHTPIIITDNVKDASNLKVVMRFDAAYLAIRHDGVLEGHYHNYGAQFNEIVNGILNNPEAIIRLANGRLNLLGTVEHKKGNTSIASVELNTVQNIDNKYDYYNLVVTVTPAQDNYIRNLSQKAKNVEYVKKDLEQVNPQLYKWLSIFNTKSSINSISSTKDVVKQEITSAKTSIKQIPALFTNSNVGVTKNDNTSHLYDIRDWNKDGTADPSKTDAPMPGKAGVSITSDSFNNNIPSTKDSVKLSDVDSPTVNRIADETFPIQPKTNRAEAKYEKTVAHDTKVRLADIQDSMFHPVMRSIKDAVPISERTLAKARSLKEIPYDISMYEDTEKAIVGLAKFIKENYSGKYDVQGNLLLPEETVQSNNIVSNASYLKDAEPTTECNRQTIYRAFLKVVTDQLGRPVIPLSVGVLNLRGSNTNRFARYRVRTQANVQIPTGGAVTPIAVALTVNGSVIPESVAIVTPAAVGQYWHVNTEATITVPCGCCVTVSAVYYDGTEDEAAVTPTPSITVRRNAPINVERIA